LTILVLAGTWTRGSKPTLSISSSAGTSHRGPNPFFWAIDSGDDVTGVTVHRLEAEYDTGDILAQQSIAVGAMNAWQLARALDRPSLRTLREVVGDIAVGRPRAATAQKSEDATWAPEPTGELLRVDWRWPTERILRRIRALAPVPGLALEYEGVRFFVTEAARTEDFASALLPGEAFLATRLLLRTGDGAISVERARLAPSDAGAMKDPMDDESGLGIELRGETLVSLLSAGPPQ
jgi:methionyl-tRNA formyltransferase